MDVVCCVLSGRGLCDGLIIRSEESYRLWRVAMCDRVTSYARRPIEGYKIHTHYGLCSARGKKIAIIVLILMDLLAELLFSLRGPLFWKRWILLSDSHSCLLLQAVGVAVSNMLTILTLLWTKGVPSRVCRPAVHRITQNVGATSHF